MLSGRTRLAGVMGWPVTHSRSPLIHNHWCASLAIDGAYVPLAVAPDAIGTAVRGLAALGFRGANLTIPHKEIVLPHLDSVDPAARRIGAANTVVVRPDGSLHGFNTDGLGFVASLAEQAPAFAPAGKRALILGAGGAARAIAVALEDAGCMLRIANRTAERAATLVAETGLAATTVAWGDRSAALAGTDLLVNTTALGMSGQPALEIDLAAMPVDGVVADIVYAPLETPLLAAARARGLAAVDGLGMLLHQAVPGFEAWFGVRPVVTPTLRRLVERDLRTAS